MRCQLSMLSPTIPLLSGPLSRNTLLFRVDQPERLFFTKADSFVSPAEPRALHAFDASDAHWYRNRRTESSALARPSRLGGCALAIIHCHSNGTSAVYQ